MSVFRHATGVLSEQLYDQAVVIDQAGNGLITLNPVGAIVWQAIDGERDVGEIAEHVAGFFEGLDPDLIEPDVVAFIAELEQHQLLEEIQPAQHPQ